MRISLNELKDTEAFLFGTMPAEEASLFRAKMILNPQLRHDVSLLKRTFSAIRLFGRRRLHFEIHNVEQMIFHQSAHHDFQKEIESIFLKH